ncbi:4-coumarate-CoA ligase [Dactylonectria estremocensis]|uniref:4-coumarate-CoA ligase n=1 Tax=Dactylonectria estremocensis TaxID=1079267 RepID=A0A9P9IZ05_9HYPO|nr:4-coumarate-CoA ligase [Dactylonectria estremocensis]
MVIYTNPEPLNYPSDATITDVLFHHNLNDTPDEKPAIIDGISGEVVGVKQGAVVGILSTNKNYYPICVHAILAVGGVVSALNPLYEPNELAHALGLSEPAHVLVEQALFPKLVAALGTLPSLFETPSLHVWDTVESQPGVYEALNVDNVIQHGSADFKPPSYAPGTAAKRLAFICFSSGTSGLVKGVKLSHGNIVANIFQQSQGLRGMFVPETVVALIVPFFHVLGLAGFCCQYVCQGAPIVTFKRFEVGPLMEAVRKHSITHINVVPPIALELLRNPATQGEYPSIKCLINAAAPLNQRQADQLCEKFGCVVTQWYGMTEASPSIASQRENEVGIPGTIGRLLPGIEMRIVDEDFNNARVGEFAIRGPNIMQGYVDSGKRSDSPHTPDGFLRTGDIGHVDENGYLYIVDRAKEMIKVKGNQVAPAELEAILITHPRVIDAAVCGVYNEHGTSEMPVGYITTDVQGAEEQQLLKADVLKHVHSQVSRYKQITGGLHILSAIPRNPAGKILRRLLPAKLEAANRTSVPARL